MDREWAGSLASDTEYCYCDTDRYKSCDNYIRFIKTIYFRCNDKMGDEGQLNTTQGEIHHSQYSLEQQQSYNHYNYDMQQGGMKSGFGKMQLSSFVRVFLMINILYRV
jgi:hypothetical protein